ncbi:MAG: 50S ribosomal protein L18 [Candidatus Nealsonbacteria bacterium]|nr:50S ribosomal protein L18 [Candidatus Nealsonbacteria bacterium]
MAVQNKREKQHRRRQRVRVKIFGHFSRPRLSVFRSNKHIFAQLIDDDQKKTLAAASDLKIKKTKKTDAAYKVGKLIAEKAKELNVEKVIFDRGKCKYHGRIKAVAEGAREGGLKF